MTRAPLETWAESDGVRLRVLDWGGGGERDVLFLHGLASVAEWWNLVAPRLAAEGIRPVAFDQRGHGHSDRPEGGYDYAQMTADALAVAEQMEMSDLVVVGHSWGGATAIVAAATRPDAVAGAMSVDGALVAFRELMTWEQAEKALEPPRWRQPIESLLAMIRSGDLGEVWGPEIEAIVRALFEEKQPGLWGARFPFEAHMQVVRHMYEADVEGWLSSLERPVLLLFARGRGDPAWIEAKEAFVRGLGHEHVREGWLDDSIHDVPLQRPELVARHIVELCAEI